MINIVIPMAGEGSRFSKAGYDNPKPFIDVCGKPMIELVIENLKCLNAKFILIGRKEHLEKEINLVNYIKKKYNAEFISIDKLTEGTACTVLFARKFINNEDPLLIANSDQIVDINIQDFIDDSFNRKLDGSILTFKDIELNSKWSFAKIDENNLLIEVKEKKVISEYATVGIYLFNKGKTFFDAAVDMIINNERINNEFYTCPVYNFCILNNQKFGIFNIDFNKMHGLGTPEDLIKYINKNQNSLS